MSKQALIGYGDRKTRTVADVDPFLSAPPGNTPLVPFDRLALRLGLTRRLYGKLEQFNPGGSAKDRTAAAMVDAALRDGLILETGGRKPLLIESSSGNLGIALARQAARRGWDFLCVVDPRANKHSIELMRAAGATVEVLEQPDPETGDWLTARRARVAELVAEIPEAVNLNQYSNQAAFHAHAEGTMAEILTTLKREPGWLFVAVSTTGTLGGCQRKLVEVNAQTTTVAVDAAGSVLFKGKAASRVLPGFGAGIEPELAKHVIPDQVARVSARDAIVGARLLQASEGIMPGASGGAVVAAVVAAAACGEFEGESDDPIVMVLHDSGVGYSDTIYDDRWVEQQCGLTSGDMAEAMDYLLEQGSTDSLKK